ncbi:MAG TPA: SOS response-associated peptidase [Feifaniaceae bacterium]|nr:SOS response-associated peptidase [Feifaniaceae bacterium]
MCGRFYTDDDDAQYRAVLALLYQRNPDDTALLLRKSGEIFPTDKVPVLDASGPRLMEWGFSRFDGKGRVINARSETVLEKSMFRTPMANGRCLIPAASYFEWEKRGSEKIKYKLRPKGEGMFTFAGLYRAESGSQLPLFVILTAPAVDGISFIHDRMPLMLPPSAQEDWLNHTDHAANLLEHGNTEIEYEICG